MTLQYSADTMDLGLLLTAMMILCGRTMQAILIYERDLKSWPRSIRKSRIIKMREELASDQEAMRQNLITTQRIIVLLEKYSQSLNEMLESWELMKDTSEP